MFCCKPHCVFQQFGIAAQLQRGLGRAGERDHILTVHVIQQIARASGNQLQRAFGQYPAVDHQAHASFGHIGRGGCGFDDRGHPCQQGRGEFFQHAPDRKVERVDMQRGTLQRGADMLPLKLARAAQLFGATVKIDMPIRHLAPPFGREHQHRANATVHVDQMIRLRRTRLKAEVIQRLAMIAQVQRQRLEQAGAVVEGHGTQGRCADVAGIGAHALHIQRVIPGLCNHIAGYCALNCART